MPLCFLNIFPGHIIFIGTKANASSLSPPSNKQIRKNGMKKIWSHDKWTKMKQQHIFRRVCVYLLNIVNARFCIIALSANGMAQNFTHNIILLSKLWIFPSLCCGLRDQLRTELFTPAPHLGGIQRQLSVLLINPKRTLLFSKIFSGQNFKQNSNLP